MRAVMLEAFDVPPVLAEVASRPLGAGEVRVRQAYSSVAAGDALMAAGAPYVFRPVFSLMMRPAVLGRDVAGVVTEVGPGVSGVAVGDRVVGEASLAWADEVAVDASMLAVLPDAVGFAEACTLSVSGMTALQGLRKGELVAGDRVLIVGASGGVGHLAVQLAAAAGARVTGVCSGAKADAVREAGAQAVVDYATTPLTELDERYDVVFDLSGRTPLSACLSLLSEGGRYVSGAGTNGGWLLGPIPRLLQVAVRGLWDRRVRSFVSSPTRADYEVLLGMIVEGTLRPWVGEEVPLEAAGEALERLRSGQGRGKTVLRF